MNKISVFALLLFVVIFLVIFNTGCTQKPKKDFKACWVCKGHHWSPEDCEYVCPTRPEEDKDNMYEW